MDENELYYATDWLTGAIYHEGTYNECYKWLHDQDNKEIIEMLENTVVIMSVKNWFKNFVEEYENE